MKEVQEKLLPGELGVEDANPGDIAYYWQVSSNAGWVGSSGPSARG
jgi:hypothetical protein